MAKLDINRMVGVNGHEFARLHNEFERDVAAILGIVVGQSVDIPIFGAVDAEGAIDLIRFSQKSDLSVDGSVGVEFYDRGRRCRLSFAGGKLRTFSKSGGVWVELFDIENPTEPALTDKSDVQGSVALTSENAEKVLGVTSTEPWMFRLYPTTYLSTGAASMPDLTDVDDHIAYFANYCLGVGGTVDNPVLVMVPLPVNRATWAAMGREYLYAENENAIITDWLSIPETWIGSGISINNSYFLDHDPFTKNKTGAFIQLGVGAFKVRFLVAIISMRTFGGALFMNVNPYASSPGTVVHPGPGGRQIVRFGASSFYIESSGLYMLNGPEYHVINRRYDAQFYVTALCNAPDGGVFKVQMEISRMN